MKATVLLYFLSQFFQFSICEGKSDKIFCYYESIANFRPGRGKFLIQDVDPTLCTHYIYAFLGIDPVTGNFDILNFYGDIMKGTINQNFFA
jgi:chitinase